MRPELKKELDEIETRAQQVLDGFVGPRQRVARDCIKLCRAVGRLSEAIDNLKKDRPAQFQGIDAFMDSVGKDIFGDMFGDTRRKG